MELENIVANTVLLKAREGKRLGATIPACLPLGGGQAVFFQTHVMILAESWELCLSTSVHDSGYGGSLDTFFFPDKKAEGLSPMGGCVGTRQFYALSRYLLTCHIFHPTCFRWLHVTPPPRHPLMVSLATALRGRLG